MSQGFVPLSVRRGLRDPLPYSEGVPDHIRHQAFSWVSALINAGEFGSELSTMVASLQVPTAREADLVGFKQLDLKGRIMAHCDSNGDAFLDVLDYLLHTRTTEWHYLNGQVVTGRSTGPDVPAGALSELLDAGRSCWRVGWTEKSSGNPPLKVVRRTYRLERRVTEAAEQEYLHARGIGGKAGDKLTEAWHAAYGRAENAEQCWKASVAAVEAALQPVVSPKNPGAQLGVMLNDIQVAPRKWECDLPVWGKEKITPTEAFLNVLSRVTYENGRHGGGERVPKMREARAVLMVAVTVVEWVRDGVFRRAGEA